LAGGITWYLSLESTSVAANTAIYMSLPAFIFVLSVPVLRERPTVLKVLAVFVQVGGVCIVAVSKDPCAQGHPNSTDSSNSSHILGVSTKTHCGQPGTPLGYVLLLISVLTYALFEILYKKFASFKDDPASIPNSFRMIGLIGIHCLVYSWPLVIIAHFSGLQPFQWPTLCKCTVCIACLCLCLSLSSSGIQIHFDDKCLGFYFERIFDSRGFFDFSTICRVRLLVCSFRIPSVCMHTIRSGQRWLYHCLCTIKFLITA
jgi:drug/metabolite transporter (DMT)-like permease